MQAENERVEREIHASLSNASATELDISASGCWYHRNPPPLTANDARPIISCLRDNPRFRTLNVGYPLTDPAVLDIFRDSLPLCTAVTTVILHTRHGTKKLSNEGLQRLLPAFYNTSVTSLHIGDSNIQGQRGFEVIRDLLVGNKTLLVLGLGGSPIGPEGSLVLGNGLAVNKWLQKLYLGSCSIGNDDLANLLMSMGDENNDSLTDLDLGYNNIQGAEGGRQVTQLLQRCPSLKVLHLAGNNLGPLGACALAPGLAAASHLESLYLYGCGLLGNDGGLASLVPDGHVNRTLTSLDIYRRNGITTGIQDLVAGENAIAWAARCTNLDSLAVDESIFSPDQRHRLDLLLDRKRLCTRAAALAGSPFPVLFRAVEEAHGHEHGLSAIFVILQNDGDDLFYTAHNRAIG